MITVSYRVEIPLSIHRPLICSIAFFFGLRLTICLTVSQGLTIKNWKYLLSLTKNGDHFLVNILVFLLFFSNGINSCMIKERFID